MHTQHIWNCNSSSKGQKLLKTKLSLKIGNLADTCLTYIEYISSVFHRTVLSSVALRI